MKKLGIWIDFDSAQIIEFNGKGEEPNVIDSVVNTESEAKSPGTGKPIVENKEQPLQSDFYKKIGDIILDFSEVVLFGPSKEKTELMKFLKRDKDFAGIRIVVKQANKMSADDQLSFVYDYFSPG